MEVHKEPGGMDQSTQSPFKVASMPGTPLQQLSPERLNQRIPQSPSLLINFDPNNRKAQHRLSDASDVKARIAMLNSMSQNGSPTRSMSPTKPGHSSSSHAAIQRAVMGREEAEATLNAMTAQLETAKARERLVAERVESLMEQLTETRSRQRHERQVYEKEVKNAKKTEYKAELAVIKLQEELREVKSELEVVKARAEHDKAEKEKARQEAFERAYAIAGMTEETQTLKEMLKVVEQERDNAVVMAASRMAREEEIQTKAMVVDVEPSQGQIEEDSNAKRRTLMPSAPVQSHKALLTPDDMDLDAADCPLEVKLEALQQQIVQLQRERQETQDLIHFMNMQCQFKVCPCRVADRNGVRFVHDYEYDQKIRADNAKKRKIEDDRPCAKPLSWMQKRELRLTKQPIRSNAEATRETSESTPTEPYFESKGASPEQDPEQKGEPLEAEAPLPPLQVNTSETEIAEHIAEVEVAAQIALPSPIETPNHTAQLEEITQVMVEPGTSCQPFFFSTSVSSSKHVDDTKDTSHLCQNNHLQDDLFDLSPPKQVIPRPSTAMGILTVTSPIRLVPESPHSNLTQPEESTGNTSRAYTTRVALNDTSPVRQARSHQRSQSRVAVRNQSRGRSPAVHLASRSDVETDRPTSALSMGSPASNTVFPITPVTRYAHVREKSLTQPRPQQYIDSEFRFVTESKMTTTIPLRDESELILSPAPDCHNGERATSSMVDTSMTSLRDPLANVPGTPITREAALAQIRARRDRARSLNMRNRGEESQVEGTEHREMKTPGSVARRGVKIDLGARLGLTVERGRDVSHASAPGRF